MKSFYLANHRSDVLRSLPFEELIKKPECPKFATKLEMLAWAQEETTDHVFYSLAEPKDPDRRLTKDNPVAFLHGFVADFDTRLSRDEVIKGIAKVPADFPVAYASSTFSGGCRLVWQLEEPVPMFDPAICKAVLARIAREFRLRKLLPGYDEGAFLDPAKPYELGRDWFAVNPQAKIPTSFITSVVFEASKKINWRDLGTLLPLDEVAAEVERRWPGRWDGPFAVGAMGRRFWDATADNPKGAWIRETGVQAFTGEGRFLPWAEILGSEFVSKYERERIGGAIDDLRYDGRAYWYRNHEGHWVDYNTDICRLILRDHGLRSEGRRGEMSEVDRAIKQIAIDRRVDGAFPFLYRDDALVSVNGRQYLNISRVRPVLPADGAREWGEGFPWLKSYLEQIFDEYQLHVFLSWLAHYYKGALASRVRKGHGLFIAGPAGVGKTFLSQRVIGGLMGGAEEATQFLLGQTQFNSNLFEAPLWTIDDAVANTEGKAHEVYSQVVKKVVANFSLTYRRMFSNPVTLPWEGRIVVTLNDDPDSIAMLPNVEQSMLEKVMFLLAQQTKVNFDGAEAAVRSELPAFGAFLRDWQTPPEMVGDYRYGIKAYHHPTLLESAKLSSLTSSFLELLTIWRTHYFRTCDDAEWSGSASELLQDFAQTETLKPILSRTVTSTIRMGRDLNKIILQRRVDWLTTKIVEGRREFFIKRP